mgnify:CR=1 FL=1
MSKLLFVKCDSMKYILKCLLVSLLLFSVISFAALVPTPVVITGTVYNDDEGEVRLTGTLIQVSDGQNITYVTQAETYGRFSLTLENRSYFFLLSRASYPDQVYLYNADSSAGISLIMPTKTTVSKVYGRLAGATANQTTVYLLKGGLVTARANANRNGLYLFPSVMAGNYELRVGGSNKSWPVKAVQAELIKLDLNLMKEPSIILTKGEWGTGEAVTLSVLEDNVSVAQAEAVITNLATNSTLKLLSNSNGTVSVSLLAPGSYEASFKGAVANFIVLAPPAPLANNTSNATTNTTQPPAKPPATPPPSQPAGSGNEAIELIAIPALVAVSVLVVAVVAVFAFVIYKGYIKL